MGHVGEVPPWRHAEDLRHAAYQTPKRSFDAWRAARPKAPPQIATVSVERRAPAGKRASLAESVTRGQSVADARVVLLFDARWWRGRCLLVGDAGYAPSLASGQGTTPDAEQREAAIAPRRLAIVI